MTLYAIGTEENRLISIDQKIDYSKDEKTKDNVSIIKIRHNCRFEDSPTLFDTYDMADLNRYRIYRDRDKAEIQNCDKLDVLLKGSNPSAISYLKIFSIEIKEAKK